jgi:N-acetylglucosamine-6-phosphate deacetylase
MAALSEPAGTTPVVIEAGAAVIGDGVQRDVAVLVENGVILGIAPAGSYQFAAAAQIDARHLTLIPGLIDIHIHGGFGLDFYGNADELEELAHALPRWGVTTVLPTLGAQPLEALSAAVERLVAYMRAAEHGCRFAGIHLEGPYFNPKRKGAQYEDAIRPPDVDEVRALLGLAPGLIRLMTLAPEMPGADDVLRELDAAGVMASVGHSEATMETLTSATRLGLRHATHTFNAMLGLHHRSPGTVAAVLALDEIECELIADGVHVDPIVLLVAWKAKGTDRIVLVSDATAVAGMPDGIYDQGHRVVTVSAGRATLADGTLAGSCAPLIDGVRTMVQVCHVPLADAVRMASANPARSAGCAHRTGSIEVGKDADLVLVDDALVPRLTMVRGAVEYNANA